MVFEMMLFLFIVVFFFTNSTLWMSVSLVPISFMLMMSNNSTWFNMVFWLFLMVFVGGVLILLVGISSILSHEESQLNFSFFPVVLIAILLCSSSSVEMSMKEKILSSSEWGTELFFIELTLLVLFISVCVITKLVFSFKGMMRSI